MVQQIMCKLLYDHNIHDQLQNLISFIILIAISFQEILLTTDKNVQSYVEVYLN